MTALPLPPPPDDEWPDIPLPATPAVPPPPGPQPEPPGHPYAMVVGDMVREAIWTASYTTDRSLQTQTGPSGLGELCGRKLAYGETGVTPVNFPDPLRMQFGSAFHDHLARIFTRMDHGVGRYLIEQPVVYRGIPGRLDLFDRRRGLLIDWKTTALSARKMRSHGGPDRRAVIQVTTYALGLRAQGENVELICLVHIPSDGKLNDIRVWVSPITDEFVAQAEGAIDRYESLVGAEPANLPAHPSELCPWCPWHRPGHADLTTACPGE